MRLKAMTSRACLRAWSRSVALLACLLLAAGDAGSQNSPTVPPPGDAAVLAAELRGALTDGSNAALIGFIARHPDEPLADAARSRLAARTELDPAPAVGPDAEVHAAFDAARLSVEPQAMADFAKQYAHHPLGREAGHPIWRR